MAIITAIMEVFTAILSWFGSAFSTVTALFYDAETGLTFVGVVACLTFGVALFTLVAGWIRGLIR